MPTTTESWVTDADGRIIGKDTTEHHEDGSSTTTHQEAWTPGVLFEPRAGKITGVTENDADGTSKNYPR